MGKGLVTRAVRAIIDWAVEERGIHRVEWWVSAENEPSIAVARRLGMTKEGVLRESYLYRGKRHDEEIWAVLAPQWRAARNAPGRHERVESPTACSAPSCRRAL